MLVTLFSRTEQGGDFQSVARMEERKHYICSSRLEGCLNPCCFVTFFMTSHHVAPPHLAISRLNLSAARSVTPNNFIYMLSAAYPE